MFNQMSKIVRLALCVAAASGLFTIPGQAAVGQIEDADENASNTETAIFAGGCFWCMEAIYQEVEGVTQAVSGFTGGRLKSPTYKGNHQGHWEAVEVIFDPEIISYQELLDIYWINVDPFDDTGQFCDKGPSYRSAIFYTDAAQKRLAEASRKAVMARFDKQVVTDIRGANRFWPVEEYHQDYYKKRPFRYRFYRTGCGRDARLKQIWGAGAH